MPLVDPGCEQPGGGSFFVPAVLDSMLLVNVVCLDKLFLMAASLVPLVEKLIDLPLFLLSQVRLFLAHDGVPYVLP
jgi:hypothetical protein